MVKFIHLIAALGLLGATFYCFGRACRYKMTVPLLFHHFMLYLSLAVIVTGTYLVYLKQIGFQTPWIQAAYLLVISYTLVIFLIKKWQSRQPINLFPKTLSLIYCLLIIILIVAMHDAVTKTTFLTAAQNPIL